MTRILNFLCVELFFWNSHISQLIELDCRSYQRKFLLEDSVISGGIAKWYENQIGSGFCEILFKSDVEGIKTLRHEMILYKKKLKNIDCLLQFIYIKNNYKELFHINLTQRSVTC